MTEPNKLLLSDGEIPTVTLGGVKWPIPQLAPRQLRPALPLIGRCMPLISNLTKLEEMNDNLFQDAATVVYLGLSRGHKELTRDEFDDIAMDVPEVVGAFFVVVQQTYAMKPASKTETNGILSGEAAGALQSTGTV